MNRQETVATVLPLSREVAKMIRHLEAIQQELVQLAEDARNDTMTVYDERQPDLPISE